MTYKQALCLNAGDRVKIWSGRPGEIFGQVIGTSENGTLIQIKWDDGLIGHLHAKDMADVERVGE